MLLPQIWMTDEELAAMLGCSATEARRRVLLERLDRKISRDGNRRSKLNGRLAAIFVARVRTMDAMTDHEVGDLRTRERPRAPDRSVRLLPAG
jgi:hypothetical protein